MGMSTHKIKGEDYYQCRDVKAERDKLLEEVAELLDRLEAAEKERDALRAKIEVMERQEPVAWCATDETGTVIEALGMNQSRRFDTALYLAPGAQPAPSVPDAYWKQAVEEISDEGFGAVFKRLISDRAAMLAAYQEPKP